MARDNKTYAQKLLEVFDFIDNDQTVITLHGACRAIGISDKTFFSWVIRCDDEDISRQYARIKDVLSDRQAKAIVELTEAPYPVDDKGKIDPAAVQARRLEVDTKKWLLSKQAARRYGDRVSMEVSGNGGGPIAVASTINIAGLSDAALRELVALADKSNEQKPD